MIDFPFFTWFVLYCVYFVALFASSFAGLFVAFEMARELGILACLGHVGEELFAGYIPIGIVIIIISAIVGLRPVLKPRKSS